MNKQGKDNPFYVVLKDKIESIIFFVVAANSVMKPFFQWVAEQQLFVPLTLYYDYLIRPKLVYIGNVIILFIFLVKLVYVFNRKRINEYSAIINLYDILHKDYFHNMRTSIVHIEQMEDIVKNALENECFEEYELLYTQGYSELMNVVQDCVNQVSDIMNDYMGMPEIGKGTICACVKMVGIDESTKSIEGKSLVTVARSKNTPTKRKRKVKKDIIGKNTDFLNLSKGYRNYYAGTRLHELQKSGKYNNSTEHFAYESTIVVPLRYQSIKTNVKKNRNRTIEIKVNNDVDIVGYLCIDSTKVIDEWNNPDEIDQVVKILSVYADSLYIYLHSFRNVFSINKFKGDQL
ncbi:MAG: hypothetical protein K6E53_15275 [Lachnospiraceae bacterium]|nr:hypothetical protein [Lachnospiraceae bacterium]